MSIIVLVLDKLISLLGAICNVSYGVIPNAEKACANVKSKFLKAIFLVIVFVVSLYYLIHKDIIDFYIPFISETITVVEDEQNSTTAEQSEETIPRFKCAENPFDEAENENIDISTIQEDINSEKNAPTPVYRNNSTVINSSEDSSNLCLPEDTILDDTISQNNESSVVTQPYEAIEQPVENECASSTVNPLYTVPSLEVDLSEYYGVSDSGLSESINGKDEFRVISQEIIVTYNTEQHIISETVTYSYDPTPISISEETISEYIVLPPEY